MENNPEPGKENSPKIEKIPDLPTAVRRRPGMYFGTGGNEAIPRFFYDLLYTFMVKAPSNYLGSMHVSVIEEDNRQMFDIHFEGLSLPFLPSSDPSIWTAPTNEPCRWQMDYLLAATADCLLEVSDGQRKSSFQWKGGYPGEAQTAASEGAPFIRIRLQPAPELFQTAEPDHLYKMAGVLRNFAILRAGMPVSFQSDLLDNPIRYFYKEGMRSYLFEADYQRWPQHQGCLGFRAQDGTSLAEGYVRFLHAGNAQIQSFVNYHPTQGGVHVTGFGKALKEMFGPDARGCRNVLLIPDPDTGKKIYLPHSCIGVLHLQIPHPRYRGPTKDILGNDGVQDFIYQAAKVQLKEQWEKLRNRW